MRHEGPGKRRWVVGVAALAVMSVLGATAAFASHTFNDVPDDHVFHNAIEWMKDSGITVGCNPPANTDYCPDDFTTRGQMAAFFARFANAGVVDADTVDGLHASDFLRSNGKAADSDLLDGLDSTEFVKHSEVDELGGVPGPQGPPGDPATISTENVTIREASEESGLIVLGNTYTALCEPGEIAIGGGYDAEFTLVDLEGVELPIIGDVLGLVIDLADLESALDGVATVNVNSEGPVEDGGLWGWQIGTTGNISADITVKAICAG